MQPNLDGARVLRAVRHMGRERGVHQLTLTKGAVKTEKDYGANHNAQPLHDFSRSLLLCLSRTQMWVPHGTLNDHPLPE